MAEALWDRGYSCVLFDFAGCGGSPGPSEDITLSGQVEDLRAVVDFVILEGASPVVVVGRSLGAATALCEAALDPRVAGVCAWACPVDFQEVFRLPLAVQETLEPGASLFIPTPGGGFRVKHDFFLDLRRHDILRCGAALAPRPLLVIQAGHDEVVPSTHGESLFAAAGRPKELWAIGGADHRFSHRHQEVWEVLFSWLARHFSPGAGRD
jgi:pimeloyl-ACP methyl ester carboxylesterase